MGSWEFSLEDLVGLCGLRDFDQVSQWNAGHDSETSEVLRRKEFLNSVAVFWRSALAHFLVTGHTGFKGAWLSLLLKSRGYRVSGFSDSAQTGSLYLRARLNKDIDHDLRGDVRDLDQVKQAVRKVKPDFLIHMAAQSLVREGYREPFQTYETNLIGTLNILKASAEEASIKSQLIVTSDKVYSPSSKPHRFHESDSLGGSDPYSASKAAADLIAQEWLKSGRTKPGAIVRAGNVIGAGDVSRDRLLPDIVRACKSRTVVRIRYPRATRPWQHALDCVNTYIVLMEKMEKKLVPFNDVWNIGPDGANNVEVYDVLNLVSEHLGESAPEFVLENTDIHETESLLLDTSKSRSLIQAPQLWSLTEAVRDSVSEVLFSGIWDAREHMLGQVNRFRYRRDLIDDSEG